MLTLLANTTRRLLSVTGKVHPPTLSSSRRRGPIFLSSPALPLAALAAALLFSLSAQAQSIHGLAKLRVDDLRLSSYITAQQAVALAADEAGRTESVTIFQNLGVSKLYIEVYRSGLEVEEATLAALRDFYEGEEFLTAGAIATVSGEGFGVEADTGMYWLNYQAGKTREDIESVIRRTARVFDTLIVDDFFCTGDESAMSAEAKGERSWSEYRRALMTEVAEKHVVGPAREENPDIHLIVKYPQWYDRFHVYGYDVLTFPKLFDEVWVGTETRGAYTPRFGYTQPYEAFVNYRWLAGIAGEKIGGGWFDHADCDELDYIDQAWQSVLAGAKEIVLFEYSVLKAGHPGHALLQRDFEALADLAKHVAEHPVTGISAYKPAHSDPGGETYVMDFLGMLGIPLIPTHVWPSGRGTLYLPTHAAADPSAAGRAVDHIAGGGSIVMSLGFVATDPLLAEKAGLDGPAELHPMTATTLLTGGEKRSGSGLRLAGKMKPGTAQAVLTALVDGEEVPYLTLLKNGEQHVWVLNIHTYSQDDFSEAGEALLSPAPIGMLDMEQEWVDIVRYAFTHALPWKATAPGRVTVQPLGDTGFYVQNYRQEPSEANLTFSNGPHEATIFTLNESGGYTSSIVRGDKLELVMPPRSGVWVKRLGR